MIKVYAYDWKETTDSFYEDLATEWQGRKCFFYNYDSQSDDFVIVVSENELTPQEIINAVEEENE